MTIDDQLTRDLGDAFRAATADLTYSGRVPTPHRRSLIAVPAVIAGVAGVAAAAAISAGDHPVDTRLAIQSTASPTPSLPAATRPAHAHLVTKRLSLAGYSFSYTQLAGNDRLVGRFVSKVPADAKPVQTDGPAKAFVGVDPTTGYNAAFVVPDSGRILSVSSADASQAELVTMLKSDQPTAVPVVGDSDSDSDN